MASTRGYEPTAVDIMGVDKNGDKDAFIQQSLPYWRNNLTALSQYHNIYFVAAEATVFVYQPLFPFQRLGDRPRLKLTPPLAKPHAPGHFSRSRPHTINRLMVGDLGDEEILLLCTDSGNVAAYRTSSVQRALDTNYSRFNQVGVVDDSGVRAFFSQAVQRSAWGLAIHKTARMIAVSSNASPHDHSFDWGSSAKVTVFAFALSGRRFVPAKDPEDEGLLDDGFSEWTDSKSEWAASRNSLDSISRSRNYKIILGDHEHNIPNISFLNTDQDPHGNWLFSTDILCNIYAWRIWDQVQHQVWVMGEGVRSNGNSYSETMGWNVVALNSTSFRKSSSIREFCGSDRVHCTGNFVNITGLRPPALKPKGVQDFVRMQHNNDGNDKISFGEPDVEFSDDDDGIGEGVSLARHSEGSPMADSSADELYAEGDIEMAVEEYESESETGVSVEGTRSAQQTLLEAEIIDVSPSQPVSNERTDGLASRSLSDPGVTSDDEAEESDSSLSSTPAGNDINVEANNVANAADTQSEVDVDDLPGVENGARHQTKVKATFSQKAEASQQVKRPDTRKYDVPSIPMLYASNNSVHLMTFSARTTEHVQCNNPLYASRGMLFPQGMNRMNMTEYIRELGVVVIATQAGRVGILSLTTHPVSDMPGFRIDWILPSQNCEDGVDPPGIPLHGIAVSPIQGQMLERDTAISSEGNSPQSDRSATGTVIVDGVPRTFDNKLVLLPKNPASGEVDFWRRYRLMLYYHDHTVLTYEIGRPGLSMAI